MIYVSKYNNFGNLCVLNSTWCRDPGNMYEDHEGLIMWIDRLVYWVIGGNVCRR